MKNIALLILVLGTVPAWAEVPTDTDYYLNSVVPGWYQLKAGNPEAPWLLPGLPLVAGGTYLLLAPSSDQTAATIAPGIYATNLNAWGIFLSSVGNTEWIYSVYDSARDRLWSYNGNLDLDGVLSAPFDPAVVSDPRVWGLVGLGALVATTSQLKTWADVRASGTNLPPLPVSSALQWGLTLSAAAMAGYSEELLFRGLLQPGLISKGWDRNVAVLTTSFGFGVVHLTNMLLTPPKTERDWITAWSQVAGATIFGLYNGWQALDGANGLRRAIATHFWWNALALLSNQLIAVDSHNGDWSLMFSPAGDQVSTSY